MTITRKDLIIDKYLLLKEDLKNFVVDDSVFPSLNNYELSDIIFGLNYYFPKGGENNYVDTIERLMRDKNININDNDFSDVVNIIIDFINFLNNI